MAKESKYDETGKSREADLKGRYTYRWHGLPEGLYTITTWKLFGYKPVDFDVFTAWVQSNDNSENYKMFSLDQVTELRGKDATARREVFQSFDSLSARDVYMRLDSILRKRPGNKTNETFLYLAEHRRPEILKHAELTHRIRLGYAPQPYLNFFAGWVNDRRHRLWRRKMADRLIAQSRERGEPFPNHSLWRKWDNGIKAQWQ